MYLPVGMHEKKGRKKGLTRSYEEKMQATSQTLNTPGAVKRSLNLSLNQIWFILRGDPRFFPAPVPQMHSPKMINAEVAREPDRRDCEKPKNCGSHGVLHGFNSVSMLRTHSLNNLVGIKSDSQTISFKDVFTKQPAMPRAGF